MAIPTITVESDPQPTPPSLAEFIVETPGVCSGEARIVGTRIKVRHVFGWVERMGKSPAEVVAEYPHLTMAQVHAALAYYWSHRDEIERASAAEDKLVAEMKAKAGPSKLQERLADPNASDDPLPPG